MPCIYLACRLRKRLIILFRLTHRLALATEDCTLFQTSLWVCSAKYESNSYLDPWRVGLETHPLWAASRLPDLQDLLAGKRGLDLSSPWVARQQPLDLWNQPTSLIVGRAEVSRSSVSPIKRKYMFETLFTCIVFIFERPLRGWPRLAGRGTIPVGPVTLGAAQL